MEERISRGLWPHPPIAREELLAAVVEAVEERRWFPRPWEPARPGEPLKEGGVIERQTPDRYVYRAQRSHPLNPHLMADFAEMVFRTAAQAAEHYIRWNLDRLNLDGWRIA